MVVFNRDSVGLVTTRLSLSWNDNWFLNKLSTATGIQGLSSSYLLAIVAAAPLGYKGNCHYGIVNTGNNTRCFFPVGLSDSHSVERFISTNSRLIIMTVRSDGGSNANSEVCQIFVQIEKKLLSSKLYETKFFQQYIC